MGATAERCARYAGRVRWIAIALALVACSRERVTSNAPDASDVADTVTVDTSPPVDTATSFDAQSVTLEDRCKRHDDCVAIGLYPDGDLRCCLACIPQRAANKTSADAFIAMCAHERAMRECPVYDCTAPTLDPRCVGGHCLLAPRAGP